MTCANCTAAFSTTLTKGEQNLFFQAIALTKKIAMSSMVLKPELLLDCSLSMGIKS